MHTQKQSGHNLHNLANTINQITSSNQGSSISLESNLKHKKRVETEISGDDSDMDMDTETDTERSTTPTTPAIPYKIPSDPTSNNLTEGSPKVETVLDLDLDLPIHVSPLTSDPNYF